MRLKGRVALVIGGGNGIGRAAAEEFSAEGATVFIADSDRKSGEEAAGEIRARGTRASFSLCEASNRSSIEAVTETAVEQYGRLDVLLYSVGVMEQKTFFEITEEHFDRIISINLRGALFAAQAAARQMVKQGGGGSLINVSSVGGQLASENTLAYGASKAGLIHLTKSIAIALAPYGIRSNSVGPGSTETKMLASMRAEDRRAMLTRTPLRRFGNPSEIAKVALFLASDDSSYITGQTIWADGGRLVLNRTVKVDDNSIK